MNGWIQAGALALLMACGAQAGAGVAGTAVREAAEMIGPRAGRAVAAAAADEGAAAATKAAARHGDEALPLLRASGEAGANALDQAGAKAPEVIRLYARKGDEAVWIISEPKTLAIFIKHGDAAADALLKHRGIAENLIGRHGEASVGALNAVSRGGAQRMAMASEDGVFSASARSAELFGVIGRHGDAAMDFIWRNKGALTVAGLLGTFLHDPAVYINGAKDLIVTPVVEPIAQRTNWTLLIGVALAICFLPFMARSIARARAALKAEAEK